MQQETLWQRRLTRRSLLRGAILGSVGLAAGAVIGCDYVNNDSTVNRKASEDTKDVIEKYFKDTRPVEITFLPPIDYTKPSDRTNTWRVEGARIHRSNPFDENGGVLTILLPENFKKSEAFEVQEAVLLVNNGKELSVQIIKIEKAEDLISNQYINPTDRSKTAIQVNFFSDESVDNLYRQNLDLYIISIDYQRTEPIPGSQRVFKLKPQSK